ncbi:hypothetical protein R6Q59_024070 [Mikania micrantha]
MEKLHAELGKSLKGKEIINKEDVQNLTYLNLVIRETLRLHPPLPLVMPRECRQPMNLAGYNVANKTRLIINVATTVIGADYEYLPFGAGRRMCLGVTLGIANVQLPLAHIMYYFRWKLPNGASNDQLDMTETFGATFQRKTELVLVPSF